MNNTQTFTGSINITGSTTLNGVLTGTSATFSGILNVTAGSSATNTNFTNNGDFISNWIGNSTLQLFSIRNNSSTGVFLNTQNSAPLRLGVSTGTTGGTIVNHFEIASTGAATFSSSVTANATSTFSNASSLSAIFSNGGALSNYNAIELRGGTAGTAVNWQISKDNSTSNAFELAASTTTGGTTYASPVFKILNTGVATFSGSVTTNSNLIVNKFSDSDYLALKIENRPITNNNTSTGYIGFYSNPGNGSNNTLSTSKIYGKFDTNSYPSARLTFSTVTGDDVYQDVMTLKNTNVGIGTTSPGYTLDVIGTGRFSGGNLRFDNSSNSVYRGIFFGATLSDATEYAYIKYQPSSGQLIFFGSPSGFGGNTLFQNNNATWLSVNSSNALSFTGATTFSSTVALSNFLRINASSTTSVSTSATTISTGSNTYGGLAIVWGNDASGNIWTDLLFYSLGQVYVIRSQDVSGGPFGRTYTVNGSGSLLLAMGGGTYTVRYQALLTS